MAEDLLCTKEPKLSCTKWQKIYLVASTARDKARREQSELYGREYDQGKVTYNDIYFQQ